MRLEQPPKDPSYDLVIVGTGFGSLFYLHKVLERAPDTRVLLLEMGDFRTPETQRETGLNSQIHYSDAYHSLPDQKRWITNIGFGGGTNCWWGLTPRMQPSDFRMKTLYGVGQNWPVTYYDLAPYYSEAEEIMQVSGDNDIGIRFPGVNYPQAPHRLSTPDEILKSANPDHHFCVPSARLRTPIGSRGACCATARCNLCPVEAKFSAFNSMLHLVDHPSVDLLTAARVTAIDIRNSIATGVHYEHGDACHLVGADQVVLGANALQNPYILLASGDRHPMLGRYLHEKLAAEIEVMLDGVDAFDGGQATSGLNFALYDRADRAAYGASAIYVENNWQSLMFRSEYGRWRQVLPLLMVTEDIPQAENKVIADRPDKPTVDHADWSTYAYDGLDAAMKALPEVLGALPVESIRVLRLKNSNAHVQGTVRMGTDPETSVVDGDMIHHKVRNLHCVGTSAWPTCSTANPSLTAAALSLRAAERAYS